RSLSFLTSCYSLPSHLHSFPTRRSSDLLWFSTTHSRNFRLTATSTLLLTVQLVLIHIWTFRVLQYLLVVCGLPILVTGASTSILSRRVLQPRASMKLRKVLSLQPS